MQHLHQLHYVQPETAAKNTHLERQLKKRPTDMKNIILEQDTRAGFSSLMKTIRRHQSTLREEEKLFL